MAKLTRAFIVDSNYIKVNYPGYVEANVDDNSLQSFIIIAQDNNLQSMIGYNMYQYIVNALITDPTGNTLSDNYQYILINYIQPSVSLWTVYNAYPTLLYKPTNKALVTKHSDESIAVGIRELEYIRAQIKNNAEFYDARIVEYIQNNVGSFPEYFYTQGVNRITPKSNAYYGGIYLYGGQYKGSNRGGCCDKAGAGIPLNWS